MWGKDFSPETHADIVRKSEEAGYKPTVDVFLPVCREPAYLLANTWKYVSALDYPDVNVYVLDDGASEEVGALAAKFGFNCECHALCCDESRLGRVGDYFRIDRKNK